MHYVMGDIHNENRKLETMLKKIAFGENDHVYLLGDLFDRGGESANPAGVYFTVLGLGERCTVVRGNHDQWLADYIRYYEALPEGKRKDCWPYVYNSFAMLQRRLTPVDLLQLAGFVDGFPDYISFCGHNHTSDFAAFPGRYLDEENRSVWRNETGNVYMMDCGCGFGGGRMACMCLESGERFYV